ncbi:MAG TPA: DUF2267 domain-containing protein [Polyangiaceae bacterium]
MEAKEIFRHVKDRAGLRTAREAERAVRATLGAMASVLAEDDGRALSAALPRDLGKCLSRRAPTEVGTLEELYAEAQRRERVAPGFAREHAQTVLEVLATTVDAEVVERLRRHLPTDIARLLQPREGGGEPPPHVHAHPAHRPSSVQTLSRSRPGTGDPIAEATHPVAHAGSVARSGAPHAERMVETARSTRPAREDETLAGARDEGRRR